MSAGLDVVIVAVFLAGFGLFVPQTGINDFLNDHQWLVPFVALTFVVVIYVEVSSSAARIHHDQVEACERRNPEVVAEVKNLEGDRTALRNNRDLVRVLLGPDGEKSPVVHRWIGGVTTAIERKSEAIGEKVQGRALYSIATDGTAREAVVINCNEAYPG